MNILPKKNWHVKNKDNIAKVRRDEELARQKEEELAKRAKMAECEDRLNVLRTKRAKLNDGSLRPSDGRQDNGSLDSFIPVTSRHKGALKKQTLVAPSTWRVDKPNSNPITTHNELFNLFDLDDGKATTNADYEREKKEDQEKFEKSIGLLTYVGETVIADKKNLPWYLKIKSDQPEAPSTDEKSAPSAVDLAELGKEQRRQKRLTDMDPIGRIHSELGKSGAPATSREKNSKVEETKPRRTSKTVIDISSSSDSSDDSSSRSSDSTRRHKKKAKRKSKKSKNRKDRRKHHRHRSPTDHSTSTGSKTIEQLRLERKKREEAERLRTNALLKTRFGRTDEDDREKQRQLEIMMDDRRRAYNSAFNPEISELRRMQRDR